MLAHLAQQVARDQRDVLAPFVEAGHRDAQAKPGEARQGVGNLSTQVKALAVESHDRRGLSLLVVVIGPLLLRLMIVAVKGEAVQVAGFIFVGMARQAIAAALQGEGPAEIAARPDPRAAEGVECGGGGGRVHRDGRRLDRRVDHRMPAFQEAS